MSPARQPVLAQEAVFKSERQQRSAQNQRVVAAIQLRWREPRRQQQTVIAQVTGGVEQQRNLPEQEQAIDAIPVAQPGQEHPDQQRKNRRQQALVKQAQAQLIALHVLCAQGLHMQELRAAGAQLQPHLAWHVLGGDHKGVVQRRVFSFAPRSAVARHTLAFARRGAGGVMKGDAIEKNRSDAQDQLAHVVGLWRGHCANGQANPLGLRAKALAQDARVRGVGGGLRLRQGGSARFIGPKSPLLNEVLRPTAARHQGEQNGDQTKPPAQEKPAK